MTRKSFPARRLAPLAMACAAATPAFADAASELDEALRSLNAKAWTSRSLTHRDLDRLESLLKQAVPAASTDGARVAPRHAPGRTQPASSRLQPERATGSKAGAQPKLPDARNG